MPELSESEKRRLAVALGTSADDPDAFAAAEEKLREAAYDELVDWILGRRRFDSSSALDRHRVLVLFARIRQEAPTVEALANELDISESRAVSMLSRMRYGDARLIRGLTYRAAVTELEAQIAGGIAEHGQKLVWVSSDTGRLVDEANGSIMRDIESRAPGGRYENAQLARREESGRSGQQWQATEEMWAMIVAWLTDRAEELRTT